MAASARFGPYLVRAAALAAQPKAGVSLAPARAIRSVGVVGGGTMGVGIALSALYVGLDVVLLDSSEAALARAADIISNELTRAESRGRLTGAAAAARDRMSTVQSFEALAGTDMVIEAVFENLAVKQDVFRKIEPVCKPGSVLGTNTSTLDIDKIAGVTSRPGDIIGLHFFSPANIMPLLEIVRGEATSPATMATSLGFARQIRKTAVVVGNCYGFAGNRMGEGFVREAMLMLLEGATPAQVDRALTDFGMAMGPFAVADVVGIDVPYRARRENSQAAPGDRSYYRMADLLVEMGRHGQKTGRGFYIYRPGSRTPWLDPEVMELARGEAQALGVSPRALDDEEIVDRCLLPIINEGFKVLEEDIADRASDLDVIYTSGYGFPASKGGPMAYAQVRGLDVILARIREFEKRYGSTYWAPSQLLVDLVESGRPAIAPSNFEG